MCLLLCWRRVPEEPSNRYHARHLIDKDHPDAALGQGSSFTRSYSPEQLIADSQCSQAAAENLYTSVAVGHCESQSSGMV
jgi:hypothetical protein